jgi:hypothetical protein
LREDIEGARADRHGMVAMTQRARPRRVGSGLPGSC